MLQPVSRAAAHLEKDAVASISGFLLDQMNEDGGFRDRAGRSDLYYTVFGMTTLAALGAGFPVGKTWKYLENFENGSGLDFVHLACLVRCRAICRFLRQENDLPDAERSVLTGLERFRVARGGYSHVEEGAERGSVYAAFLAHCAYGDCGLVMPQFDDVVRSVESLKHACGGFSNENGTVSGSTTATAAALVLLKNAGKKTDPAAVDWLVKRCTDRGGFLAGEDAPVPDLLSTGTALYALRTVGESPGGKEEICREFIDLLWMDDGGFAGSPLDLTTDCEYTFYALLGLGSLVYGNTR